MIQFCHGDNSDVKFICSQKCVKKYVGNGNGSTENVIDAEQPEKTTKKQSSCDAATQTDNGPERVLTEMNSNGAKRTQKSTDNDESIFPKRRTFLMDDENEVPLTKKSKAEE